MYEQLLKEAEDLGIETFEKPLSAKIKGLYSNRIIWINKNVRTSIHKACILAEEIGHFHRTVGDILDQGSINNRKQELLARSWAYERLIPLYKLVQAQKAGVTNRYELADYLGVTEEFVQYALNRYKEKYGLYKMVNGYQLFFDPLNVS